MIELLYGLAGGSVIKFRRINLGVWFELFDALTVQYNL
jgi:hypothetical protein